MDEIRNRIEYHRSAAALVPEPESEDPGLAVWLAGEKQQAGSLTCNCRQYKKQKTCPHIRELSGFIKKHLETPGAGELDASFRDSVWARMAAALHEVSRVSPEEAVVQKRPEADNPQTAVEIEAGSGSWHLAYFPDHRTQEGPESEQGLLLERLNLSPGPEKPQDDSPDNGRDFHRGSVLSLLARMTLSETERVMAQKGFQTRRQAMETGFWYRFAYHCYRMSGEQGAGFSAESDARSGRLAIFCQWGGHPLFRLSLPPEKSRRVISRMSGELKNPEDFRMYPEALESIVRVAADAEHNLHLTLCLRLTLPDDSSEVFERKALRKFWQGDAVYFPKKGFFATVKQPDVLWEEFGGKYRKKIRKNKVPELLDQIGIDLFGPPHIVDESVRRMRVYSECRAVELSPRSVDRDWCWLSISYGFGENAEVTLDELYQAQKSGRRFISVPDGWVDSRAVDLDALLNLPGSSISAQLAPNSEADGEASGQGVQLSRMELLRLRAAAGASSEAEFTVTGEEGPERREIEQLLSLSPPAPYVQPEGLATKLRSYQERGVEWLLFLYKNQFGGMLCDDMGLGKTHQVMALMAWLASEDKTPGPFLVVCPTSVISHWARKIQEHAPGLSPVVYHGADRELEGADQMDQPGRVLITSYGILFRDIDELTGFRFAIAAFDEAQSIKNPETKSHAAARAIQAQMKLAVTGTPIENRLAELKALMDLCLPGYLGTDSDFEARYGELGDGGPLKRRKTELNRVIAPFTLRRLKSQVLTELPEKIEDIRYCRLTEAQVRLYRQAVNQSGRGLVRALETGGGEIPYIHIFALLTLLKQICDHPAIIDPARYEKMEMPLDSGKWTLFTELLQSCLEAGEKVVVYSQFVPMIRMMEQYFAENGIDAVSLTGSTRNRGEVIERFNTDPACRVFAGSLRAGGTGIDLIGGSVVIHYDRWWNAAREDQATDRVHRIGQKRGVQVFKLVTEGTLEEKIAAIIARKKALMADIVQADDPGVLKAFSRDELVDLLSVPT